MENISEMDRLYQEALDQLPDQRMIDSKLSELSPEIQLNIPDEKLIYEKI